MLYKKDADLEVKLLHELIEGCLEAEGYVLTKITNTYYKVKSKQGHELNVRISVKGA